MSPISFDELESDLRALFDRQADAAPVTFREWDGLVVTSVADVDSRRRRRPALTTLVATAAAVALVAAIAAIDPGAKTVRVGGQPDSASAVRFTTPQVDLSAGRVDIEAGGKTFTTSGANVAVHSDPGTPNKYTTLELEWLEHGVGMRMYAYFTSDGHDWWANELRTYNGNADGHWIEYTGTYFREPLGTAYAGNVDLTANDGSGHIRLSDAHLEAFVRPTVCNRATTQYVLDPQYDRIDMPKGANGFGFGTTNVLNAATCSAVADPYAFTYDWTIANPAVAEIEVDADQPLRTTWLGIEPTHTLDLAPTGPGTTTLHLVAHRKSDGAVVATATIPITVG